MRHIEAKTIVVPGFDVYKYDELDPDAQERAFNHWFEHCSHDDWFDAWDCRGVIKKVEELFHVTLDDWSVGGYRPSYPTIEYDDWWYTGIDGKPNALDLAGNRAVAFCWNNFGHVLYEPATRMHWWDNDGRRHSGICIGAKHSVRRKSHVFFDRVYDGTCPLTGVCYDNDALDPMAYFCFGTHWDEKAQARVQDDPRDRKYYASHTVKNVVKECVNSLFDAFNKEDEWYQSKECFEDECDSNGWEFTEDGDLYDE